MILDFTRTVPSTAQNILSVDNIRDNYRLTSLSNRGWSLDAGAPPVAKPGHSCLTNLFMARASQNPVHARKFQVSTAKHDIMTE